MKTFWEHFLDEIARKQEAGEINEEKAQAWIAEIRETLNAFAEKYPEAPIVQMPQTH